MIEYHAALASAPLTESQNNQFLRPTTKGLTAFSARLFEMAISGCSRNLSRYFLSLIVYVTAFLNDSVLASTVDIHSKNSSTTVFDSVFLRFIFSSLGKGSPVRLPSASFPAYSRSSAKSLSIYSIAFAATDVFQRDLSFGSASIYLRLACAQQPQRVAFVSLLYPSKPSHTMYPE